MSLTGEKQLMKQYSHLSASTDNGGLSWIFEPAMTTGMGNWHQQQHGGSTWIWQQNYFDLSGLKPDKLTTQLLAVALQKPYEPVLWKNVFGPAELWGDYLQLFVYLSDVPVLTNDLPDDLIAFANSAITGTYPSFSTFESGEVGPPLEQDYQYAISWQNLLYAEQTMYTSNSNADSTNLKVPLYTRYYGSGNATASDRIYCTLIWRVGNYTDPATGAPDPEATGTFFLPPLRIVAGTQVLKEGDLPYVDRLRRSYVEQRGYDNA